MVKPTPVAPGPADADVPRQRRPSGSSPQGYGPAFRGALGQAGATTRFILGHPAQVSFYTVVFLIATAAAMGGIVTLVFFPVFVMGYITVVDNLVRRTPPRAQDFIGFMRHGWHALWHLFMMLASLFILLAVILAPFVLLLYGLGFLGTTLTSAYVTLTAPAEPETPKWTRKEETQRASLLLDDYRSLVLEEEAKKQLALWSKEIFAELQSMLQKERTEEEQRAAEAEAAMRKEQEDLRRRAEEERRLKDAWNRAASENAFRKAKEVYEAWKARRLQEWEKEMERPRDSGSLWQFIQNSVVLATAILVMAVLLCPITSVMILFFSLAWEVTSAKGRPEAEFDLVYDAFGRVLEIARAYRKEILISGLVVSFAFGLVLFVVGISGQIFLSLKMPAMALWTTHGLLPVLLLVLVLYTVVFMASTALRLHALDSRA